MLVSCLVQAQLRLVWLNLAHLDIAGGFTESFSNIDRSHFLNFQCVQFEGLKEVAALVTHPLQHVCVVVHLVQVVLVDDARDFVQMSRDFIGLARRVLIHLHVCLYLLVEVQDEVIVDH